jgi:hydrogenase maturation protease
MQAAGSSTSASGTDVRVRTVIGYGNLLRGDDGVGPAVAELLAARHPDLRTLAVPMLVPELAPELADAAVVVFVDAREGITPGTVRTQSLTAAATMGALGHLLSPGALVALAHLLYGRCADVFQVTVDAAQFDVGAELSSAVEEAIPVAADAVLKILSRSAARGARERSGTPASRPSLHRSSPTR